ncbi:TonB-dependent receptor [Acinetobacter sp. WZC-1]|uniref:TonB-dependent receptor n=1 Tax=Acinetobacter sp. WZC-1 TaxID=3459034 RepID=UPI00403DDF2D
MVSRECRPVFQKNRKKLRALNTALLGAITLLQAGIARADESPAQPMSEQNAGNQVQPEAALPAIHVQAVQHQNFAEGQVARKGNLGILGELDYMESPFSQLSYTSQAIKNQRAISVAEALTTADSSVRTSIGSANRYDALTIRGFRIENGDIALNGLYGLVPAYRVGVDPIERIDLLKGAGAFLYGISPNGSIGGSVNAVTKRAAATPLTELTAEYEQDGHYGIHTDLSRRFGTDQQFGLRLNAAHRDGDTRIDGQSSRNTSASVGADYQNDKFNLSGDVIYQKDRMHRLARGYTIEPGIPMPAAPDPKINLSQDYDYSDSDSLTALTRAEYRPDESLKVYATVGHNWFNYDKQEAPGPVIQNAQGDARSVSTFQSGKIKTLSAEAGLNKSFQTGPVSHQLVASVNTMRQTSWLGQQNRAEYMTNIYQPVFYENAGPVIGGQDEVRSSENYLTSFALGDSLSLMDDTIKLIAGARHQQVRSANFSDQGVKTSKYDESKVTPSAALVYRPFKSTSFYVNYIEALSVATAPADAINAQTVFKPYKSKQYEAGVKFDFDDFGASAAIFQINQPNGVLDPSTSIYSLDGRQKNRGLELNGFGKMTDSLSLLGGMTFMDTQLKNTEDSSNEGNHAVGVPKFQANANLEWKVPYIPDFILSGRVIHTGKAYINQDNQQTVPDWTRVDLSGRYSMMLNHTPVSLQANLNNVANKKYWEANPSGYVISGMPRTLLLSATVSF